MRSRTRLQQHFCPVVLTTQVRHTSDAAPQHSQRITWKTFWRGPNVKPNYPSSLSPHPGGLRLKKTAPAWNLHHGYGGGGFSRYGPIRELPDWEYEDGTPIPISPSRYGMMHHMDHLLVQMIKAGAEVEQKAEEGRLPRIPATREQRAWDPKIPLFLEDMDSHGAPPLWHYTEDVQKRAIECKYSQDRTSKALVDKNNGESLTPITMFANYDPADFINEPIKNDPRRPFWSRRKWGLSESYLVKKSTGPKNTIEDK